MRHTPLNLLQFFAYKLLLSLNWMANVMNDLVYEHVLVIFALNGRLIPSTLSNDIFQLLSRHHELLASACFSVRIVRAVIQKAIHPVCLLHRT